MKLKGYFEFDVLISDGNEIITKKYRQKFNHSLQEINLLKKNFETANNVRNVKVIFKGNEWEIGK